MNEQMPNIDSIIEVLARDARIEAAYLMGSAVRGTLRPDSDLDIAILPVNGYRFDDVGRVESSLCENSKIFHRRGR